MTALELATSGEKVQPLSDQNYEIPVSNDGDFSFSSATVDPYGIAAKLVLKHARSVKYRNKLGRPRGDRPGVRLLPTPDQFRYDPSSRKRFELTDLHFPTPVNELGLVVVPDLIKLVKSIVVASHKWSPELTIHHLYSPEIDYERHPDPLVATFRDLPINKLVVPRSFENLLHAITDPPPMPSIEVMRGKVSAWKITEKAFFDAKELSWWDKRARNRERLLAKGVGPLIPTRPGDDKVILSKIREDCRTGLAMSINDMQSIEPEFQLVEIPSFEVDDYQLIATKLGSVVAISALALTESIPA